MCLSPWKAKIVVPALRVRALLRLRLNRLAMIAARLPVALYASRSDGGIRHVPWELTDYVSAIW